MTVTLTATYRDTLAPETVTLIDRLLTEEFGLEEILIFIDENTEEEFCDHYMEYVELGENHGYEAVDAFVKENSVGDLKYFSDAYIGEYSDARDMAEEFFEHETDRLDYRIQIDWYETAQYLLDHEVDRVGDFYFRHNW
jgi:antirestriction protein